MFKNCEKCGCTKNVRRRVHDTNRYFYSCANCLKLFYKPAGRMCIFCKKDCRTPSGEESNFCWDTKCQEIIRQKFAKKCFYKTATQICIFCKNDSRTSSGECGNPKCQEIIREKIAKKYEAKRNK